MPYTIGIDARKIQDFGIGTYVRNLIRSLAAIDSENRYVLLAKPEDKAGLQDLPENFQVALESSPVYSVRELFALSWHLYRRKLDLYHSTHYVLPAWVNCPPTQTWLPATTIASTCPSRPAPSADQPAPVQRAIRFASTPPPTWVNPPPT